MLSVHNHSDKYMKNSWHINLVYCVITHVWSVVSLDCFWLWFTLSGSCDRNFMHQPLLPLYFVYRRRVCAQAKLSSSTPHSMVKFGIAVVLFERCVWCSAAVAWPFGVHLNGFWNADLVILTSEEETELESLFSILSYVMFMFDIWIGNMTIMHWRYWLFIVVQSATLTKHRLHVV